MNFRIFQRTGKNLYGQVGKTIPTHIKLKILMQSLYYPAVLGTVLVLFIQRVVQYPSLLEALNHFSIIFGLFAILFFSVMYLEICLTPEAIYSGVSFGIDMLEFLAIFFAFLSLGFFEALGKSQPDLKRFFFYLAGVPLLENLWNYSVGYRKEKLLWVIGALASLILLYGGYTGINFTCLTFFPFSFLPPCLFGFSFLSMIINIVIALERYFVLSGCYTCSG